MRKQRSGEEKGSLKHVRLLYWKIALLNDMK